MSYPTPRTPEPDNAQPSTRRQFWLRGPGIMVVIVVAGLALVGVLVGIDAASSGEPGASKSAAAIAVPYVDPCGGGQCPTPAPESLAPEDGATSTPSTSGPWTPCNLDDTDVSGYATSPDGCDDDFVTDSCDAAYVASKDGRGVLLDAFIENSTMVDAKRLKACPQFLDEWKIAQAGMSEGSYEVGKEVKPGTYETTAHLSGGRVTDCYWERTSKGGNIIANKLVTAAKKIRVTIRKGDGMFTSERCGDWIPAG